MMGAMFAHGESIAVIDELGFDDLVYWYEWYSAIQKQYEK
jgi:hypothetical protein